MKIRYHIILTFADNSKHTIPMVRWFSCYLYAQDLAERSYAKEVEIIDLTTGEVCYIASQNYTSIPMDEREGIMVCQ